MNYPNDFINKLIVGNCLEVMKDIPDNSIDLIITDPPYPRKYQYVYEYLFSEGSRILKPRGNLISLCGHYELPFVLDVGRKYLRFWWLLWMKQTRINRMIGVGVVVQGKPAVWFVKERRRKYPDYGMPFDSVASDKKEDNESKSLHKWGQSVSWFAHYINDLTHEDEIVLDPFVGSGTTALACKQLNRKYIGIDISEEYCDIARKRLENEI